MKFRTRVVAIIVWLLALTGCVPDGLLGEDDYSNLVSGVWTGVESYTDEFIPIGDLVNNKDFELPQKHYKGFVLNLLRECRLRAICFQTVNNADMTLSVYLDGGGEDEPETSLIRQTVFKSTSPVGVTIEFESPLTVNNEKQLIVEVLENTQPEVDEEQKVTWNFDGLIILLGG